MQAMFESCPFNGDISNWDVSNAMDMGSMFKNSVFNGDISKWTFTPFIKSMSGMFASSKFNGDISKWVMSSYSDKHGMFYECPIPEENKPKFED